MATRSSYLITENRNGEKRKIANVYFHYDGYPEGHPAEVCEWLSQSKLVNGFGEKSKLIFNGAGCLAAQFVAKFKETTGNVYLYSLEDYGKAGEEYLYEICIDGSKIEFIAKRIIWDSFINKYDGFCEIFRGSTKDFSAKYFVPVE
jgi:hypothetical protein